MYCNENLHYSSKEVSDIVAATDFNMFTDKGGWFLWQLKQLFTDYGWYNGDFFMQWIGKFIEGKTGNAMTTFAQLKTTQNKGFRELYVISTNLSQQKPEIFSHESNADTPICEAVRMSMSIPLFFRSFRKLYTG